MTMLAQITRRKVALALLAAALAFATHPGAASAQERERLPVRKGVFKGIWHTDPVTIIIEKVNRDGTFKGEIHFDPKGRWGDVRAGFTATLGRDDSLTMSRDDCIPPGATVSDQIARAGRPERQGRDIVWRGEVRGPDFTSPFELRIPLER
jgi:hypothetical protein